LESLDVSLACNSDTVYVFDPISDIWPDQVLIDDLQAQKAALHPEQKQ
jgi:hypothetical protein